MVFFMEMAPKREPKSIRWWDTFGFLSATFSEDRFVDAFWSPLAHFWHPSASKRLTFGSRWLSFGLFFAPVGSLLDPFVLATPFARSRTRCAHLAPCRGGLRGCSFGICTVLSFSEGDSYSRSAVGRGTPCVYWCYIGRLDGIYSGHFFYASTADFC